jgi:uncharacterized protein (DUF1501 family)
MLMLNDELAMNCALGGLKQLYDNGYVLIINNVGYPNPDRSHFALWTYGIAPVIPISTYLTG